MSVIYERAHNQHGRIIIHDDCLPHSAQELHSRKLEMKRAVMQALSGMVARNGVDRAKEMIEASPYNPDNWTADDVARYEEAQLARLAWWDSLIDQDIRRKNVDSDEKTKGVL